MMTPYLMMVLAVFTTYVVVLFGAWVWTQWPEPGKRPSPKTKGLLDQSGNLSAQHVAE
jgi:hypothetical protein